MNSIRLASILAKKRREKGITQEELAAYIGVSGAAVSKWEKNLSYPDIMLLPQLAAYFNISVDDLLGYSPQLTPEDTWKLCKKLSENFSNKPFDEVVAECTEVIKKYYSCFPLLYHIALLYVNHHAMTDDKDKQKRLLTEAKVLCRRIIEMSGDTLLSTDALYLQGLSALILEEPHEIFEMLGETISTQSGLSMDFMISQAFELAGNPEKAVQTSQCGTYKLLMMFVESLMYHVTLTGNSFEAGETAFLRAMELVRLFNMKEVDVNTTLKVYVAGAIFYCRKGELEKALDLLDVYADLCVGTSFPLEFKGDNFFTEVGGWMASDFYAEVPYDAKMIKQSMLSTLTTVSEIPKVLQDEPRYKSIVQKMTDFAEREE